MVGFRAHFVLALRPHIPRLLGSICIDGWLSNCLSDEFLCHCAGHHGVSWARQDSTATTFQSWQVGPASEYSRRLLGGLHRCGILYPNDVPGDFEKYELDKVREATIALVALN